MCIRDRRTKSGLCLINGEEMNLDAWIDYQAKGKLSTDTKYDVKLKRNEFAIKRINGTVQTLSNSRNP